jgi:hypothetical protein
MMARTLSLARNDEIIGAGQARAASLFFGEPQRQPVQHGMNRLLASRRKRSGFTHFAELNLDHDPKHMVFCLEVVEERPLAHVRCFGNVFHRDVGETALGKQLQRAPEQLYAGLRGAAFASPYSRILRKMTIESGFI